MFLRYLKEVSYQKCQVIKTIFTFPPESTPSDPAVSPLNDDTKSDEDNVFLSPNRSRTTEDLFAMIHRLVAFEILYVAFM